MTKIVPSCEDFFKVLYNEGTTWLKQWQREPERTVSMTTELRDLVDQLNSNINEVVLGKVEVVRLCLVALLSSEHVLLEDVPGVGKTLVAKALARSVAADFCRLKFTPDLLPSDIVGSSIFDTQTSEFVFNRGPLFANIILADEINRTPPRTQSALLEAMSDGQVSVDGKTYPLPQPFIVIATQNPFEFEGTYPLPESQLDRFLMRLSMGYESSRRRPRATRARGGRGPPPGPRSRPRTRRGSSRAAPPP